MARRTPVIAFAWERSTPMTAKLPGLLTVGTSALAILGSSAQAQELCREPYRVLPGAGKEAIAAMYPKAAAKVGVGGDVILRCLKQPNRPLQNCAVKSEFPAGYGFGRAAMRVASMNSVNVSSCGSSPKGGSYVDVPIRFRPPVGQVTPQPVSIPQRSQLPTI